MTNDDLPEPPHVLETQELAQKIVQSVVDYLASLGWDYALVSIARRIDLAPGHAVAPGATGMNVDRRRMAPALGNEADALENIARQLRSMNDLGAAEAVASYVQDKSDYAGGRGDWPKGAA